jgi:hypothetical protein
VSAIWIAHFLGWKEEMLWKSFLPLAQEGGGKFRRWARFQKAMTKKRWLEQDRERNGPITLFDFSLASDAVDAVLVDETNKKGGWRISDDSVMGGFSKATFQLIQTSDDYKQYLKGKTLDIPIEELQNKVEQEAQHDELEDEFDSAPMKGETDDETSVTSFVPFVRWKGTIDTTIPPGSDIQRSGFCAIRSPEFPFGGADLGGRYNGLEIMCRSDGRYYSLLLNVETMIPDDVYQCFINIPPTIPKGEYICPETGGKFDKVVLLFQHFIVTSGGRMRATQRVLDNAVKIESIGLTLMDGVDGVFEFDLARIRAINYDETGIIGVAD